MEELLEAVYLGNGNDGDIEDAILLNILGNIVNVAEPQQFDLNEVSEEFASFFLWRRCFLPSF